MTDRERLSIGTFAAKTGLSIKALRLYDKLGLLAPAEIDPESGTVTMNRNRSVEPS